jgi:CO/xanthine dehydrogenase Mo-binding subunit
VALPLLEQCCRAVQRKRKDGAVPLEVHRSLAAERLGSLEIGRGMREKKKTTEQESGFSWAATVIEVELDPVTFQSSCRGVWMAIEAGTLWNRADMLGVLEGEILRCLGLSRLPGYADAATYELPACTASDWIPAAKELPDIQIELLEGRGAGMKAFDCLPHLGVAPAYAAAVCQATGLYIDQVPITPEVVQQCLET